MMERVRKNVRRIDILENEKDENDEAGLSKRRILGHWFILLYLTRRRR